MKKAPPLMLVEPAFEQKQRRLAEIILGGLADYNQHEVKTRLKQIRYHAVDRMGELAGRFRRSIADLSDVHVTLANDAVEAVDLITRAVRDTRAIAINKSATTNELRSGLEEKGYRLINTYSPQFLLHGNVQRRIEFPWQLPVTLSRSAWDSFDYSEGTRQKLALAPRTMDFAALLGVNAASAEDGSIFILQHSANIGTVLGQAKQVILVIGLEKIVEKSDDAFFQTRCAGVFGMESILLDLKIGDSDQETHDPLAKVQQARESDRELQVILLDNGRTRLASSYYKELLWCIGCRACLKWCPGYRYLKGFSHYPREYLWSFLTGYNPTIELCSHCGMCQAECPVDINLPKLIARAKADYSPQLVRLRDYQVLMNITRLAPLGSLAAPVVNRLSKVKLFRIILEKITGIHRKRQLPAFHYATFERWFRSRHV